MMARTTLVSAVFIGLLAAATAAAEEPTWLTDLAVTGLIANVRGN